MKWLNLRGDDEHHNGGESDEEGSKNETNGKTVLSKGIGRPLVDMEYELDNKWNENWHSERDGIIEIDITLKQIVR
ncbi:MAG: hypothetical protein ACTS4W_00385 [Candidatus Hodgkinia cicadicola]